MKSKHVLWAGKLGALGVAGALVFHLGEGARYRLYTSAPAADCWRAVELTTLASSEITPVAVGAPARGADGRVRVSIDYTMDRVLGGRTLNVACVFAADRERLESVEFDGTALDTRALAEVNRDLED